MPTYVVLYQFTGQGIKNVKDAPARIEAGIKAAQTMGIKNLGFYAVMGEYDYVAVAEAPDDETVTTFSMALGSLGNVKTTTLRAFTTEEFAALVKKLP